MLIDIRGRRILEIDDYNIIQTENNTCVYWKGLFFIKGCPEGRESVLKVCEMFDYFSGDNPFDFSSICGSFVCIVQKGDGTILIFADNGGQNGFFISDNYIADSFLDIIEYANTSELNLEAVGEYLVYGQCFFNKTIAKGVMLSKTDCYYVIEKAECFENNKNKYGIETKRNHESFEKIFSDYGKSLSEKKATLALTGGYDSRFLLALLEPYMRLDTCISGDNFKNKDIIISKKVSDKCGVKHNLYKIDKMVISDETIRDMFVKRDAAPLGFMDSDIRIFKLYSEQSKIYDLYMTGIDGTLHKDSHWIEDFPRYHKRNFDVKRYYNHRILKIKKMLPFTQEMTHIVRKNEDRILQYLADNKKDSNTKSYDWYRWNLEHETGFKHQLMSYHKLCNIYCPLLELEVVNASYNLPRWQRSNGRNMRTIITNYNKKVARIRTWTSEMTSSSEPLYILTDYFFFLKNIIKKAIKMVVGRKLLKKVIFVGDVLTWTTQPEFRELTITKDAVKLAKEKGWILNDIEEKDIGYDLLSKLVYLYLTNERINV